MRSLATELRCVVLSVLAARIGIADMTDDDFTFLTALEGYANSRSPSTETAQASDVAKTSVGEVHAREALFSRAASVARESQPEVDPGAAHDDAALLPFDTGPEPQDATEILDTKPTASDIVPSLSSEPALSDSPPDYTRLPTQKGS